MLILLVAVLNPPQHMQLACLKMTSGISRSLLEIARKMLPSWPDSSPEPKSETRLSPGSIMSLDEV